MEKLIKYKNEDIKILINTEDEFLFNQYKWHIAKKKGILYVQSALYNRKCIQLARLILGITDVNVLVDHINQNPLDNRRVNLRLATKSTNGMNRGMAKTNTSGYKGISWDKSRKKWLAYGNKDGKHIYLGRYDTLDDAVTAYNANISKYYGEFAVLNEKKNGC